VRPGYRFSADLEVVVDTEDARDQTRPHPGNNQISV
jgi:hypothetical protein